MATQGSPASRSTAGILTLTLEQKQLHSGYVDVAREEHADVCMSYSPCAPSLSVSPQDIAYILKHYQNS